MTTWLHRVVVNACLDRVRRRQARPGDPLGDRDVASPRDEHAATETRLDVQTALSRLPQTQRVAIVLVDMEDVPVAEVARLLGVAEGTVKSRCSRGRAALAVWLRPQPRTSGNRRAGSRVAPAEEPAAPVGGQPGATAGATGGEGW